MLVSLFANLTAVLAAHFFAGAGPSGMLRASEYEQLSRAPSAESGERREHA